MTQMQFNIRYGTREHVEQIGRYADGVIVGTALVAALRDGGPPAVDAAIEAAMARKPASTSS